MIDHDELPPPPPVMVDESAITTIEHSGQPVSIGPAAIGWWFYRRAMRRCWRHDWG